MYKKVVRIADILSILYFKVHNGISKDFEYTVYVCSLRETIPCYQSSSPITRDVTITTITIYFTYILR